jgi:hypothetical protein
MLLLEDLGYERLQLLGKGTYVKAVAARKSQTLFQVLLANYDPRAQNIETVPVTFQNVEPGTYRVTKTYISRAKEVSTVATTELGLQITVPLNVSEVALVAVEKL